MIPVPPVTFTFNGFSIDPPSQISSGVVGIIAVGSSSIVSTISSESSGHGLIPVAVKVIVTLGPSEGSDMYVGVKVLVPVKLP